MLHLSQGSQSKLGELLPHRNRSVWPKAFTIRYHVTLKERKDKIIDSLRLILYEKTTPQLDFDTFSFKRGDRISPHILK